jgi:hypothetical protein
MQYSLPVLDLGSALELLLDAKCLTLLFHIFSEYGTKISYRLERGSMSRIDGDNYSYLFEGRLPAR